MAPEPRSTSDVLDVRRRRRAAGDRRAAPSATRAAASCASSGIALGGAAVAGGLVPGARACAATPKGDVAILNFALTLEYLESAFYASRAQARRPDGRAQALRARPCTQHEAAHVAALKKALGSRGGQAPDVRLRRRRHTASARSPRPRSSSRTPACRPTRARRRSSSPTTCSRPRSRSTRSRRATPPGSATSRGQAPAPVAFNPALTKNQVLAAVTATGFIK